MYKNEPRDFPIYQFHFNIRIYMTSDISVWLQMNNELWSVCDSLSYSNVNIWWSVSQWMCRILEIRREWQSCDEVKAGNIENEFYLKYSLSIILPTLAYYDTIWKVTLMFVYKVWWARPETSCGLIDFSIIIYLWADMISLHGPRTRYSLHLHPVLRDPL